MASGFNQVMNTVFGALAAPLRFAPPLVFLIVLSAVLGVLLLLLFKHTSPQTAIGRAKTRIFASIYEIRLFKDDFGVLSRAIGRLFRDNAVYLACCLVAMVPAILVVLPFLFQLDARYGFDPLQPGRAVTLDVHLAEGVDPVAADVALELPPGVALDAGPVRVPSTRELVYRLRVEEPGIHEITLVVDGERYAKRVDAARHDLEPVSPSRFKSSRWMDALMFPVEKPWPEDAKVEAMLLQHRRAAMLGMDGDTYPWAIIFFVVSVVFAFALKGVFKVNI